jgi:hypothetical protein
MRTAYALALAASLAGSAVLALPAGAVEVCDKTCVGPACAKDCVREPDVTVGRDRDRDHDASLRSATGTASPVSSLRKEKEIIAPALMLKSDDDNKSAIRTSPLCPPVQAGFFRRAND